MKNDLGSRLRLQRRWIATSLLVVGWLTASPLAAQTCDLPVEISRVVTKVETGDRFLIDDGSTVVLLGALPPIDLEQSADGTGWAPAVASKEALTSLIGGKTVDLAFAGRRVDRYGRLQAQVHVRDGDTNRWVQGTLLERGFARAYALPGGSPCWGSLVASENRARASTSGHWASGVFQDRSASLPRDLAAYRQTFQTVEGRIAKTANVRGQRGLRFWR